MFFLVILACLITEDMETEAADLPVLRGPAEPLHNNHKLRWNHRVSMPDNGPVNDTQSSIDVNFLSLLFYTSTKIFNVPASCLL